MNYLDKVRQIWPNVTDEQAAWLLDNATCYPFGPDSRVFEQLAEAHAMSGGDVLVAVEQAHAATERGMRQYAGDARDGVDLGGTES